MQLLLELDEKLLLLVNGMHNDALDFFFSWMSNRWIWIPLYAWLLYLYYRRFGKKIIYVVLAITVLIVLTDQTASGLLKNLVMRLRPCHVNGLADSIHLVNGYCGGAYGFVSSHAANTAGLTAFFWFTMRQQHATLAWILVGWTFLIMLSRVYLGVHYPGDVLGGAALGWMYGWLIQRMFHTLVLPRQHPDNDSSLVQS